MSDDYKYDVAFSFLTIDEPIALQLHAKLQGRLSSFHYADAERQRLIAGRDGDAVYSGVFGTQARTVVVLYRAEWGKTGFTQIESTAIRNRAFDHGYEFVTFINRDGSPLPPWLPKTRVWIGLDRLGVDVAAAVIESRVQEAGGEPHEETAIGRAERMRAEMVAESERQAFFNSQEGANAALAGCREIFERVKVISEQSKHHIGEPRRVQGRSFTFELPSNCDHWQISVAWNPWANNTAEKAELVVREWHGSILEGAIGRAGLPQPKKTTLFVLDYRNEVPGWREKPHGNRFYRHEELADWIANRLLTRIEERRQRGEDE